MKDLFKRYRPAIFFVLRFLIFYLVFNLAYGFYIESFYPLADNATAVVSEHTVKALNVFGVDASSIPHNERPNIIILDSYQNYILEVYEGCNGLNVMIIFVAFLVAFNPSKKLVWFIPLGILLIHLGNIIRVGLLFFVSKEMPDYLYFTHKYLFTAFIFAIVFVLWFWWVRIVRTSKNN